MPPGTTKRRTRSAVARRAQRATAAADPASTAPGVGEERFCPDPLAGLLVGGRYRIEAAIGDGGYGAVYRARHTETGGLVAVKFLRAEVRPDKSAVRRFCLEAQNAAALSHPNTIRVTDFGVDGNLLFYAMEYLEGHSLAELMSGPERLSWRRSLRIVAQALSALCAAHEHPRRIVHRDIKPGNIMVLHPPGHEDFVKVIDFGIARALQGTLTSTRGVACSSSKKWPTLTCRADASWISVPTGGVVAPFSIWETTTGSMPASPASSSTVFP